MADRKKVIRGFELCAYDPDPGQELKEIRSCPECPYYRAGCSPQLIRDALAMLKEQEPRLLTLEEVCNLKYDDVVYYQGINTNSVESAIVLHGEKMVPEVNTRVVQFRHADGTGGWNGINNADLNGYGKKWRCWTSRPTPEQMRETPWEGDSDAE